MCAGNMPQCDRHIVGLSRWPPLIYAIMMAADVLAPNQQPPWWTQCRWKCIINQMYITSISRCNYINNRQISNISCTLVGNKLVDHSGLVGALPVGATPTTPSSSTQHPASMDWAKTNARRDEKLLNFEIWCDLLEVWRYVRERSGHDDVIKWKHFPRYWPFMRGIHRSTVNSPHKGQWRGALMFSLICVWINGWVNNREAGD